MWRIKQVELALASQSRLKVPCPIAGVCRATASPGKVRYGGYVPPADMFKLTQRKIRVLFVAGYHPRHLTVVFVRHARLVSGQILPHRKSSWGVGSEHCLVGKKVLQHLHNVSDVWLTAVLESLLRLFIYRTEYTNIYYLFLYLRLSKSSTLTIFSPSSFRSDLVSIL